MLAQGQQVSRSRPPLKKRPIRYTGRNDGQGRLNFEIDKSRNKRPSGANVQEPPKSPCRKENPPVSIIDDLETDEMDYCLSDILHNLRHPLRDFYGFGGDESSRSGASKRIDPHVLQRPSRNPSSRPVQPRRNQTQTPTPYPPNSAFSQYYRTNGEQTQKATFKREPVQDGASQPHGSRGLLTGPSWRKIQNWTAYSHQQQFSTSSFQPSSKTQKIGGNMAKYSGTKQKEPNKMEVTRAGLPAPRLVASDDDWPPPNRPYPTRKFIARVDDQLLQETLQDSSNMKDNQNTGSNDLRLLRGLRQEIESMESRLPKLPQVQRDEFNPQYAVSYFTFGITTPMCRDSQDRLAICESFVDYPSSLHSVTD